LRNFAFFFAAFALQNANFGTEIILLPEVKNHLKSALKKYFTAAFLQS